MTLITKMILVLTAKSVHKCFFGIILNDICNNNKNYQQSSPWLNGQITDFNAL